MPKLDYEPLLPGVFHAPQPIPYRCEYGGTTPEECAERCVGAIEDIIKFQGPDSVAAVVAEPVASPMGSAVPGPNYWPRLREICDQYGCLLIADEVINGFGRTGKMFCCENWGVTPDIMAVAKGFSGGYLPLGAAIATDRIAEAFRASGSGFRHVHTYSGHAVACAAALANIEIIRKEGLVQKAAALGAYLKPKLEELYKYPIVGDVRGIGTLWAVELVANRETRAPFSPPGRAGSFIGSACWESGIILRNNGDILVIAPALIMTDEQADEMTGMLDSAIAEAMKRCTADNGTLQWSE
jgi:adenosylmethionine-8-amino-7-oxononanoate aminotransferase